MNKPMNYDIQHDIDNATFETIVDGYRAFVKYEIIDNAFSIYSTVVPDPIGGRGIAKALVKASYDYALAHNFKCQASCSYAIAYLKRQGLA